MTKIRSIWNSFIRNYYTKKIYRTAKKCGEHLWCGGKSYVTYNTILGNNVNFNGMAVFGEGNIVIGDNFHSGSGCQIISSFHNYDSDDMIPYGHGYIHKDVKIGDNVWLGNNVIILGGVEIGEGAIIQAGSVVCKNIPPYAIAGGHPAVPFKQRNIEHYEKLKKEKKFH